MRYFALCADYDGTLAHHGDVPDEAVAALKRVQASGRKLIMVTGRVLDELTERFPELGIFDMVVAENGGVLYNPKTRDETLLAEAPPKGFLKALKARGARDVMAGRVVVATWTPHEVEALELIKEMGLELQIVFNKGAVMVLPATVNKALGLAAALEQMGLSPHNAVGVGDAENDHAFLSMCECSVAVSNALDAVKERCDWVTKGDHATGVIELCDRLVENDLQSVGKKLSRHHVLLGEGEDGKEALLPSYGVSMLVAGSSGSGKSSAATGVLERLAEKGYQFCIIDPEGDYPGFQGAVALGDSNRAPTPDEVLEVLEKPDANVVVNMLGVSLEDRPEYFAGLWPRLQELRAKSGRPHWVVVDEAHHVMPRERNVATIASPGDASGVMLISVHPDLIAPAVLQAITHVVILGKKPKESIKAFASTVGETAPKLGESKLAHREAIVWDRRKESASRVKIQRDTQRLKRHTRKYAEGDLGPDRSFYFTGPQNRMNLRAQNLMLFSQIGEGVDDDTWNYHLKRGDYSAWFREHIKDEKLADKVAQIEKKVPSAEDSRRLIREAIEVDYTLPAGEATGWESEDADHQNR
jgi:HAD superfamily hydrolase (TIGR01484 family)